MDSEKPDLKAMAEQLREQRKGRDYARSRLSGLVEEAELSDSDLPTAARYVAPVDLPRLEALRNWSKGRCLSASYPGLYAGPVQAPQVKEPLRIIKKKGTGS